MIFKTGKHLFSEDSLYVALQQASAERVLPENLDLKAYSKKLIDYANFSAFFDETTGETMAYAVFYDNDERNKIAFLSFIYVYQDFRGQGKATELLHFIIKQLKERDFKCFRLEVHRDNHTAIQIYKQIGFKVESETKSETFIMQIAL